MAMTPRLFDRLNAWRKRLRTLTRRAEVERDLEDELAFHLRMEEQKKIREGLDAVSARRAALVAFGGVEGTKEAVRDVRSFGWWEDVRRDVHHALRSFRRAPAFTSAAILTLALGVGATTAVFSVVHAVLIEPLPYAEPERLVRIWETNPAQGIDRGAVSPGTLSDLRSRSRTLTGVALFFDRDFLLTFGDRPSVVRGASVTPSLLEVLRVQPALGPGFAAEVDDIEADGSQVLISHGLWQRQFGGAMDVIGQSIRDQDLSALTVVGVMPPGFDFPNGAQVWFPMPTRASVTPVQRQWRYYEAMARLGERSTLEQAQAEVAAIATRLEAEYPASSAGWGVRLERLDESIVGGTRATLLVLLGLVGCLLLIASVNVANLGIARAATRRHEVAVRAALGAAGPRLVRQWATEGALLALLGGVAGVALAQACIRLLIVIAPAGIPRLDEASLSGVVLAFAVALTCGTAVATSLAPAVHSARTRPSDSLTGGARRTGGGGARVRQWLVGAEVALTVILLVCATLLLRSFVHLQGVDLGFDREHVLTIDVRVPIGHFLDETERPWFQRVAFYESLIADLESVPGVVAVAGVTDVPLANQVLDGTLWRTDAPGAQGRNPPTTAEDQWKAAIPVVTPDYFRTMGIPLLRGRGFLPSDRSTAEQLSGPAADLAPGVAVINRAMAARYFGDEDPLGKTIFLFDDQAFASYRTVVGVVGDVRTRAIAEPAAPAVYLPFAQHPGRGLSLVIRAGSSAGTVATAVAERLSEYPQVATSEIRPLSSVVSDAIARPKFNVILAGVFAVLALLLAATGIAGVVAYLAGRRTNEIGIRVAVGAGRADIFRLLLGDGLRPVVVGLVLGCMVALGAAQSLRALLFGLAPIDAVSFALASAVLLIVACVATVLPARKAMRIDPVVALRDTR